jgi:hypothetical protein
MRGVFCHSWPEGDLSMIEIPQRDSPPWYRGRAIPFRRKPEEPCQPPTMKRRELIALLGSAAATWPLAAHAQRPATPVVGFVNAGSPEGYRPMVAAFPQGLQESGYAEGRDVAIEYHWAEGKNDRLPAIVADLVRR